MKNKKRKSIRMSTVILSLLIIAGLSYFMIQANKKEDTQIWSRSVGNFGESKVSGPSDMINYYIAFDSNGGTGTMQNITVSNYSSCVLSKNQFTKENYIFQGWNTKADGTGVSYEDEQEITEPLSMTAEETITLYAQWKREEACTIKFETGKRDSQLENVSINSEEDKDNPMPIPTYTGECFVGWYKEAEHQTKVKTYRDLEFGDAQTITLYADWASFARVRSYTVRFHNNEGNGSMGYEIFTCGQATTLPNNTFSKENAIFVGWNTKADGTGDSYQDEQSVTDLTEAGGVVDLYAQWQEEGMIQVTGISLNKTNETILVANKMSLEATVFPEDATNKKVTWTSSDEEVAVVYDGGLVTGLREGRATITATTEDGGKQARCEITVRAVGVEGITIQPKEVTLEPGETETLKATLSPGNATYRNITWESSDEEVATVQKGEEKAIVTAGGKTGTTTITATTEDGNKTATCEVTVYIPVTGVTIEPGDVQLEKGEQQQLRAKVTPENATNQAIVWSTSDPTVAHVSDDGVISAGRSGSTLVWAKAEEDENYYAICHVTVIAHVEGISLDKEKITLQEGETETLKATFNPSNSSNQNIIWTSSDEEIATVEKSGDNSGTVTGQKEGTATITATTEDGNKTATCEVTVSKAKETTYTVKFNSNGGTGIMEDQIFVKDKAQKLSLNQFKKEGFQFVAWTTKANGEGEKYADGSSVTNLTTSETITLYAQWEEQEETVKQSVIKHETNGGNTISDKTINIETVPDTWGDITIPKREGYQFEGWYLEKDLKTKIERYSDLKLEAGKTYTIYAKWKKQDEPIKDPDQSKPGQQGGQTTNQGNNGNEDKKVVTGDNTITNLKMPKTGTTIFLPIAIIAILVTMIGLYYKLKKLKGIH